MKLASLNDLIERFAQVSSVDSVLLDEQSLEDGVIQQPASVVLDIGIDRSNIGREPDRLHKPHSTDGQCRIGMIGIGTEPETILPQLVQPLPNLVLRQALLSQIDKSLLAPIEISELLLEYGTQFPQGRLLVNHGLLNVVQDQVHERVVEVKRSVVLDNVVFDLVGS